MVQSPSLKILLQIIFSSGSTSLYVDVFVVNVEKLKLYESPMIMDLEKNGQVPSIDDFPLEYLDKLIEHVILEKSSRTLQ